MTYVTNLLSVFFQFAWLPLSFLLSTHPYKWTLITQPAFTCSKFNNRNTRTRCDICSMLAIKTLFLLSTLKILASFWCLLLLTLNIVHIFSIVYVVNFEHVIAGCEKWVKANVFITKRRFPKIKSWRLSTIHGAFY